MPSEAGLKEILMVFAAGGTGAALRVWCAAWIDSHLADRLAAAGTLGVNLLGCLLIGLSSVALVSPVHRLVVMGGLLGGFTTYSAFGLLSVELASESKFVPLGAQLVLHLAGGMLCVYAGLRLARAMGLGVAT